MQFRIRYKKHTSQVKYGLVIVGIFAMIYLIRALINYQTILDSTATIVNEIQRTKQHTEFINHFLHPYLESSYAPYFLAHENNQLFAGERIINITRYDEQALDVISGSQEFSGGDTLDALSTQETDTREISQQWIRFLQGFRSSSQE